MSDAENNIIDENIDEDFIELDEDLNGGDEDFLDDLYEAESEPDAVGGDSKKSSEKFWAVLMVVSFVLALLSSLVLNPMIDIQQQRGDQAQEILNGIAQTNNSVRLALTAAGDYQTVQGRLDETKAAVNGLVSGGGGMSKLSGVIFNNAKRNSEVGQLWTAYSDSGQGFLNKKEEVTQLKEKVAALSAAIPKSVGESINFVDAVAKEGRNKPSAEDKDRYLFLTSIASNLNGILGGIGSSARGYFIPGNNPIELVNAQNGLVTRLQDTLNRIVGNSAAVVGASAEPLKVNYKDLERQISEISLHTSALAESNTDADSMTSQGLSLGEAVERATAPSGVVDLLGLIGNFLPILFALFGGYALWRYLILQSRELVAQEANLSETLADQQESILKLLDEMSALADGDLTVEAEVTDQITGAIADSVNFAVIEMRELVLQINRASIEVANESELAVNNAQSVSQSNMNQATKITSAAGLMAEVSESMRNMSTQATSSSEMAEESLEAAERGTKAVRDTIRGMEDMREQIQDTSKRIKRLGESSQRIGDIVALIDDIAEQTNILSLNAAIQASMAGEAGRGFAVVSDEVQSLAERSTEATKKIAELVATIQTDTNDAVLSMEKATQQVVAGTQVADSASSALSAIEGVSSRLSELVQGISDGSTKQAELVSQVSERVSKVSESSTETSRKAQASANSIAKLLELAKDLETSVSRFKLPAA